LTGKVRLGVNIDHVATVRNARGGRHPDPLRAAELALKAGADGITAHLREDRRHIGDADIDALSELCRKSGKPLNLEMAVTDEMLAIATAHRPHAACLVPERREEVTTEGGLDVARHHATVAPVVRRLRDAGVRVSLFIDPDPVQVAVAEAIGAQVVELHTGAWSEAARAGAAQKQLDSLRQAASDGARRGLEIHAGHGLDYDNVGPVAALPEIRELNIGHFLIGEAIFTGLEAAIREMRRRIDAARARPGAAA
jgi:pyridoxine 5-phosphate synthase